jgi:hypothetical protein
VSQRLAENAPDQSSERKGGTENFPYRRSSGMHCGIDKFVLGSGQNKRDLRGDDLEL